MAALAAPCRRFANKNRAPLRFLSRPETGMLSPRQNRTGATTFSRGSMRIATWNVNSIKQRVDNAVAWIGQRAPDIVCLQETKCVDEAFPREPFEALGYNVAVHGQKTFNGVAILSKLPFDEVTPRLPGENEDDHARFIEAVVSTGFGTVRVASIYLPNGNPPQTDKYSYKLRWIDRLTDYARERLRLEEPLV